LAFGEKVAPRPSNHWRRPWPSQRVGVPAKLGRRPMYGLWGRRSACWRASSRLACELRCGACREVNDGRPRAPVRTHVLAVLLGRDRPPFTEGERTDICGPGGAGSAADGEQAGRYHVCFPVGDDGPTSWVVHPRSAIFAGSRRWSNGASREAPKPITWPTPCNPWQGVRRRWSVA